MIRENIEDQKLMIIFGIMILGWNSILLPNIFVVDVY